MTVPHIKNSSDKLVNPQSVCVKKFFGVATSSGGSRISGKEVHV